MARALGSFALTALVGLTAGCTFTLDFDGYSVAPPATAPNPDLSTNGDAGPLMPEPPTPLGVGQAQFHSYRFERGAASFDVSADEGLLAGRAGALEATRDRVAAGSFVSVAGGAIELSTDGSFRYGPPGAPGAFWGDDYFEYALEAVPAATARVRLTVPPVIFDLAELPGNPRGGFGVSGALPRDGVGNSQMGPAGDINGDGLEDFVIGAMGPYDPDSFDVYVGVGRSAHVLFGKRDTSDVALADISAGLGGGFVVQGDGLDDTPDSFGYSVAGAGDVNGDGLDDIIVSGHTYDPEFEDGYVPGDPLSVPGAAFVIFGKRDAAPVSSTNIRAGRGGGFAILAAPPMRFAGYAVDGAGDVNGDGLDDVIVGVPSAGDDEHGVAFVILGKADPDPVYLADVMAGGPAGFPIVGSAEDVAFGSAVAGVGDVNGDGLDDVAASGPVYPSYDIWSGRAVVALGRRATTPLSVSDIASNPALGFAIYSADRDDQMNNVTGRGDLNGDGLDDIIIASDLASLGPPVPDLPSDIAAGDAGADAGSEYDFLDKGVVYAVFGSRTPSEVRLRDVENGSAAGIALGGGQRGQHLGWSAMNVDVTADGLSDIILSGPAGVNRGEGYVFFGTPSPVGRDISPNMSTGDGLLVLRATGIEAVGSQIYAGADFNGDGLDDFLFDAQVYSKAPQLAGGAYVAMGWDITGALRGRDRALIGTAADDVLDLPLDPIVIARGGHGIDTLRAGNGLARVDVTSPGRFESIEVIDLRGGGPQELLLDDIALRRMPQNHSGFAFDLARSLTVLGDADDTLIFDMTGYTARGGNQGRTVYGRPGLYYGIELSPEIQIRAP